MLIHLERDFKMNNWVRNKPKIEYTQKNGMYEAHEITKALQGIKGFLVEQNIALHPATEKDVENFEKTHQIVLPLAYRRFILEITDGINKDVPFSIPKLIDREIKRNLSASFPLKNFWAAEGETELNDEMFNKAFDEVNDYGQIYLDEEGLWSLIVSGECYGEVWNVGNWHTWHFTSLLFPRRDFLSWYEWCIENEVDINNGNDVDEKINLCFPNDFWDKYGDYNRS